MVLIAGEHCNAAFAVYQRPVQTVAGASSVKLQIIGTVPPFLKTQKRDKTLIDGLAAGKYTISACYSFYDSRRQQTVSGPEKVITEFEVQEGERKDLGTIKITLPDELPRIEPRPRPEPVPDTDLAPAFEP
jgi:hypothetical protein